MAKTREMVIPELAGLFVRLTDGTLVHFTDGDENGAKVPVRPNKPRPHIGTRVTMDER